MRVALIVPGGVDASGTHRVIPSILWLIERLSRSHQVSVFALSNLARAETYPLLGATVQTVPRSFKRWRILPQIFREHRREPFDVFHAFWAIPSGVVAVLVGRWLRRPALVHVGGGEVIWLDDIRYGGQGTAAGRWLTTLVLRGAATITAASRPMIREVGRFGRQAVEVPLGADRRHWQVRPPRPRGRGTPALLVHVGSVNAVKDHATLLQAVARLRAQQVDVRLDCIGEDVLDGAAVRLAQQLGLGSVVTFHGFLPQSRVRPIVERAHCMIVSSRHEAGPVCMLEAALAGVPTVGTMVGHVQDWAPDAAVSVPVGDAAALAAAIAELVSDDARRCRIAAEAQRRAIERDADWTADRFTALYEAIARRSEVMPAPHRAS